MIVLAASSPRWQSNLACFVYKCLLRPTLFLWVALISLFLASASAHNVVSGVYADGMLIEGEVGFSNGDLAEAGSPVKVFNGGGDLIAELVLDEGGAFSYQAEAVAKYVFKANLSAGHVAKMVVEANELTAPMGGIIKAPAEVVAQSTQDTSPKSESLKSEQASKPSLASTVPNHSTLSSEITVDQLQSIVRSAVAQQIRPLQKELKAYKEKVMLRDIAGGLGFIFGLFGVAAWMASRQKDKRNEGEKNATVS